MTNDSRELEEALEPMIDKHGLVFVLTLLETICYEKAEHLRTNWQDETAAKTWERDGSKIGNVARNVTN